MAFARSIRGPRHFTALSSDTKSTDTTGEFAVIEGDTCKETDTSNEFEYDGNSWEQISTDGSDHVYGLGRNIIVQAAGTYNSTEVLGFICSIASTADWSITPIGGAAVTTIDKGTFSAGGVYPLHCSSITVGTAGEAVLIIP